MNVPVIPRLYHYTSREGGQGILVTRQIYGGKTGKVYLTPELYDSGAKAANRLAILDKPVELVFAIEHHGTTIAVSRVRRIRRRGRLVRHGGGVEAARPTPVPTGDAPVLLLQNP